VNLRKAFPSVKLARADGGYAGKLVTWVVEWTLAWITRGLASRPTPGASAPALPQAT
jgi:hypothetical protein